MSVTHPHVDSAINLSQPFEDRNAAKPFAPQPKPGKKQREGKN